jgi:hypothetical protein
MVHYLDQIYLLTSMHNTLKKKTIRNFQAKTIELTTIQETC